jgi:glycosyltransferase involved in cell wall biosynthesis
VREKKVLIVTYYWPPSGGSGVQRWLKFVKYLPTFGFTPYVFTPENPAFDLKDESLENDVPPEAEVIHFPIWEPYKLFFAASEFLGSKKDNGAIHIAPSEKTTIFQKISTWVRGNFLIPDPRVFWVNPSVQFLQDFVKDNQIKIIITTGPPHSVHLIGLKLKKRNPALKWIADFRDPWSEWGLLDSLQVGKLARARHRKLEHQVLTKADKVITITPFYVRRFSALAGRNVELFTNGFDETDFEKFTIRSTDHFVIRHVGIVNEKCNPRPFMVAVKELMKGFPEFASEVKIDFVGDIHSEFQAFVNNDPLLASITTFTPPVPHEKIIDYYTTSSSLLLILTGYKDAEGYMPGKLFEYIATGLPVIGIGPVNGDAAALMNSGQVGIMIESTDQEKIIQVLADQFKHWRQKGGTMRNSGIFKYSRRQITESLARMLDSL